ncbi:DNA polymerase domain-containing protein [Paenibacillus psychroresistens]|uniref:DNA polymerase domain-containing protein n=1 Tax=Paenibacillus psychroresistens TaxID=1778678 RepID=A0A6B8RF59_9BACL|nr:non-homologous end-joining DNA ligase [Paenibacillus psychroresistens]QGQ94820.1 DNA polymerase domain-containing protein [Paenibacillus psychroresistens]
MSGNEAGILEIEGNQIPVSHPDKILWPKLKISKLLYLQKLTVLAPFLLPYCKNRYLTIIRFPNGVQGKSFYQKNAPHPLPPYVKTAEKEGVEYIHLDSLSTLLWLGNLAALEFHASFEYIGGDEPAEWVFDIDPSDEEEPRLMEAVAIIGETLETMGITSIPKTSGATGVQIIIPIQTGHTFEELRKAGHFVSEYLVEKYPHLFTIERLIKNRGNKIYIDYIQHGLGKSIAAPYTPRAREDATVSTPLLWEEVKQNINPKLFNLLTIEARLADKGDLISTMEKQDLSRILKIIK